MINSGPLNDRKKGHRWPVLKSKFSPGIFIPHPPNMISQSSTLVLVLKAWAQSQQHEHPLETSWECRFLAHAPQPLCFNKMGQGGVMMLAEA